MLLQWRFSSLASWLGVRGVKKVTAAEHQQAQAQQLKKHKSEERKKAAEAAANQLTDEEKQQYTDLAIQFEQAARNWGSDPTINLDSLQPT